jgi:hypothetical protein
VTCHCFCLSSTPSHPSTHPKSRTPTRPVFVCTTRNAVHHPSTTSGVNVFARALAYVKLLTLRRLLCPAPVRRPPAGQKARSTSHAKMPPRIAQKGPRMRATVASNSHRLVQNRTCHPHRAFNRSTPVALELVGKSSSRSTQTTHVFLFQKLSFLCR